MSYPHRSDTRFAHAQPIALLDAWEAHYHAHEIVPTRAAPDLLRADLGYACITVQASAGGCNVIIDALDAAHLPEIRTGLARHLSAYDPAIGPLDWSGAGSEGALPPTFAAATVQDVTTLGGSWWRVTLSLAPEGYARFASTEHWHFRLLRPTDPTRAPLWPRLDAHGTICWPEGADSLIERVFTVRSVDPARHQISFDIFRHPGGPTSDWAETLPIGQSVGLMGPGARTGPAPAQGAHLVVGGDETALPAILRALPACPADTTGDVFLLVGSAQDLTALPTEGAPAGLRLHWLLRAEGATEETLTASVIAALGVCPKGRTPCLWAAASRKAARALRRAAIQDYGLEKAHVHAVAYWS